MIKTLQILRGIAALSVVGFHFRVYLFADFPVLDACAAQGFMGVNLFFIISGFIMYHVTERNRDPWKFIGRRFIRIVPLYWLALLTFRGLGSLTNPDTYRSMLFIPLGGGNRDRRSSVMQPGWSAGH